ncbi:hypothetical protein [Clostridium sp.]|uniref:hypothetical protein n=1 Tax=Clostridium sp. TaxID=1506 RepID=UPI00290D6D6F|nr:hypothetical protein [Clostridium sp.]MDU4145918.1 hypothetical protein [Clostridium sp.]
MAVLTEGEVRKRLSREDLKALKEFKVVKGEIITPSAKSYLAEHNINLVCNLISIHHPFTSKNTSITFPIIY